MPLKLNKGKKAKPRRVLLYGPHGVGKSTWAANAPNHIILNFEDGLNDIDCTSTDRIKSYNELRTILMEIPTMQETVNWLVFDTLDWLETLVHDVAKGDHNSIADVPYGNGYKKAVAIWQTLISDLDHIIVSKNCGIIALAHADVKRHDPPGGDSYDRYQPALHPLASLLWQEWCDEVFHLNYRVYTKEEDVGFDKKRTIAFGESERYIRTQECPGILAKSRLSLPSEIACDWEVYEQAIRDAYKPTTQTKKEKSNG